MSAETVSLTRGAQNDCYEEITVLLERLFMETKFFNEHIHS